MNDRPREPATSGLFSAGRLYRDDASLAAIPVA
jgi:hypothetical protein